MKWSQGLFSKQYPSPDGASLPGGQSAWGRTETQYLSQTIGTPSWSQSHPGTMGVAEPFEQGCLQMQGVSVLQVSFKMPPVGGDIPAYRPLLPSEPLYLTMTSVSKTCTSHSTALCSDMRVFSGASWKKE